MRRPFRHPDLDLARAEGLAAAGLRMAFMFSRWRSLFFRDFANRALSSFRSDMTSLYTR